jgi:hypothetical protein
MDNEKINPHDIEKIAPRLKLVDAMPKLVRRLSHSRAQLAIANMMGSWGWYQCSMRHDRCQF